MKIHESEYDKKILFIILMSWITGHDGDLINKWRFTNQSNKSYLW